MTRSLFNTTHLAMKSKAMPQKFSSPSVSNGFRLSLLNASLLAACLASGVQSAHAQTPTNSPRYEPLIKPAEPKSAVLNVAPYEGNAKVGKIDVEVAADGLPADGQTPTAVTINVFDKQGKPLTEPVLITVEVSAGRIKLPGAGTDELGSRALDADRATRGTQVKVENGQTRFNLLSPTEPQDVKLRITAGEAQVLGTVSFVPELREMIAAGLIEGVIRLAKKDTAKLEQARINDGFEQELRQFSRSFDSGKGNYAARAAMFLKGKISGEALLTLAYDSDKETRARLLRDIRPEEFYPVYGDASIKGFEAKSASKLYVRVDKDKSYLMFGDFSTGDGFAQLTAGGATSGTKLNQLGAYNRTFTGGKGHLEGKSGVLNAYLSRDTLKQVVEEYRANGTSGPIAVKNSSALENSEKVEVIVRDKNALNVVLRVTVLQRFIDYTFEPFSGRILFKGPIPSLDESGNSVSIRVTYEVDQGGENFWVGGLDGQLNLGERFTIGGSYVSDKSPNSPYKLGSANFGIKLGEKTSLVAEVARSESVSYTNNNPLVGPTGVFTNPVVSTTTGRENKKGNAGRVEFNHEGEASRVRAYFMRADAGFDNLSSGLTGGKREAALQGSANLTERLKVFGEAIDSKDDLTKGKRTAGTLGLDLKLTDRLSINGGVRKTKENGLLGAQSFIGANPSPGSLFNTTGGFNGGIDPSQVNPLTGQSVTQNVNGGVGSGSSTGVASDSTSVFLGLKWGITDRFTLSGLIESDVSGDSRRRYELGAAYQIAERSRIYARAEQQTGLASLYSLNQGDKSRAFVLGVDTTYLQTTETVGQVFSEYRLRDAQNSFESQAATGLRNTFTVSEGLALSTSAEYLKVLNGNAASAAALTFGADYTASELWKSSGRIEWRRAFDNPSTVGKDSQDTWLLTLATARKLNRDWTMLARNYYLRQDNNQDALGVAKADGWQDRFQLGFAYRPVDDNRWDILGKYEYKAENNIDNSLGKAYVHVMSVHSVYHPSRPWWVSGRLAAKTRKDVFAPAEGGTTDKYNAWLIGGRLIYDVTENWDVGVLASTLQGKATGQDGQSRQYAYGLEIGYLLQQNLWLSAGYNWSGFSDKDLVGSDYTNRGAYLRLRYKFDENLFKRSDKEVNRSLDR